MTAGALRPSEQAREGQRLEPRGIDDPDATMGGVDQTTSTDRGQSLCHHWSSRADTVGDLLLRDSGLQLSGRKLGSAGSIQEVKCNALHDRAERMKGDRANAM